MTALLQRNLVTALMWSAVMLPIGTSSAAEEGNSFASALSDGEFGLAFRYRYEFVDQDGFSSDAYASTLRSRITYSSGEFRDFSALFEVDNISTIIADSYNSTRNGKTSRPVVADPRGTEVNQALLKFSGLGGTVLNYGRERINLDNQRFIGAVGWRQNEQTFDVLSLDNTSLPHTTLKYAYIYNVNRVFGPDSGTPPANADSDSHILNVRYEGLQAGTLTAYAYFLDLEELATQSNQTLGARFMGKSKVNEDLTISYTAEFATQDDYGDNPADYSADFMMLEAGVAAKGFSGKISYEVLEGDAANPGMRFVTPLATLHPFQGWADKFLVTPDAGIEDLYITLGVDVFGPKIRLVYHEFTPEDGGPDYGEELDLVVSQTFAKRYGLTLKFADYEADSHAVDTTKFWVMLSAAF